MSWQVPGYVHRRELGNGTTGRVVLAVHEASGDLVVIKYLKINGESIERVREDITLLMSLDSPYFVRIREFAEESDAPRAAIVMDAVNGCSLRLLVRDFGAFAPEASLLIFRDSLRAMVSAREIDVAHGDYRPENVLLDVDGEIVILDVGAIAWINRQITLSTGVYLAPERWRGDRISGIADVYAVTVTFVEMFVGEPPYWEASQLLSLRYMHEQDEILLDAFPQHLHDTVRRGLAKDARQRADAGALLELVEVAAIAEYGAGWESVARNHLRERVAQATLPFGAGALAVDELDSDVELAEFDDYYADDNADGAGVVAAAEEIATFARIEEVAAAGAYENPEEDVLTAEEEAAVAEVEMIVAAVGADESGADVVEGEAADEVAAGAAGAAGAADEVAVFEAESVSAEIVEADEVVAGAAAAGAVAGTEVVETTEIVEVDEVVTAAAAAGAAAGVAAVEAGSSEALEVEEVSTAAAAGAIAGAAVAGAAAAAGGIPGAIAGGETAEGATGGSAGAAAATGAAVGAAAASEAAAAPGAAATAGAGASGATGAAVGAAAAGAAVGAAAAGEAAAASGGAAAGGEAAGAPVGAAAGSAETGAAAAGAAPVGAAGGGEAAGAAAGEAAGAEKVTAPVPAGSAADTAVLPRVPASESPELAGAAVGGVAAGESRSFVRRHPWMTTLLGLVLVLICGGAALALTGKPAGEHPIANSSTQAGVIGGSPSTGNNVPVASSSSSPVSPSPTGSTGGPSASPTSPVIGPSASGTPSAGPSATPSHTPTASPSHTPAASPSHSSSVTPTPAPTPVLPKTGIHPIRQMLVVAWMLCTAGVLLLFVFRRRKDESA